MQLEQQQAQLTQYGTNLQSAQTRLSLEESSLSTATTTLHAFTGMTPSTGALWLPSVVGRSLTIGKPVSGMHMPLAEPSTATIAPQAVTGAATSAT